MYFVTDEPKLFNVETGVIWGVRPSALNTDKFIVSTDGGGVFKGTRQECGDFIYSIAGYVGAVNPIAKVNKYDETEDKILSSILDGMPS